MSRFVIVALGFMGLGFYELSGGASFDPEEEGAKRLAERLDGAPIAAQPVVARDTTPQSQPATAEVTRAARAAIIPATPPALQGNAAAATDDLPSDTVALTFQSGIELPTTSVESGAVPTLSAIAVGADEVFSPDVITPDVIDPDAVTPEQDTALIDEGGTNVVAEIPADLRRVTVSRANMRSGPGTRYGVVDKLIRDSEVEVMETSATGWAKLKVVETGIVGWMSAKLLTPPAVVPADQPQTVASAD